MTENNSGNDNHFDENLSNNSLQENKEIVGSRSNLQAYYDKIFVKIFEWYKKSINKNIFFCCITSLLSIIIATYFYINTNITEDLTISFISIPIGWFLFLKIFNQNSKRDTLFICQLDFIIIYSIFMYFIIVTVIDNNFFTAFKQLKKLETYIGILSYMFFNTIILSMATLLYEIINKKRKRKK